MKKLILIFLLFISVNLFSQGVGISEISIVPEVSSILELRTITKGFLMPRMTTLERDAIPTPVIGLLVFNTTTNEFDYFNGVVWINLIPTTSYFAMTANQTIATTTQTAITGLGFNIGANETWSFEYFIQNDCSGVNGIRYSILFPVGANLRAVANGMSNAITAITSSVITVSGTVTVAFNTVASTKGWTQISGSIINGATPGTVQLRFASRTNGQTSTVYANSYMSARKH